MFEKRPIYLGLSVMAFVLRLQYGTEPNAAAFLVLTAAILAWIEAWAKRNA